MIVVERIIEKLRELPELDNVLVTMFLDFCESKAIQTKNEVKYVEAGSNIRISDATGISHAILRVQGKDEFSIR